MNTRALMQGKGIQKKEFFLWTTPSQLFVEGGAMPAKLWTCSTYLGFQILKERTRCPP